MIGGRGTGGLPLSLSSMPAQYVSKRMQLPLPLPLCAVHLYLCLCLSATFYPHSRGHLQSQQQQQQRWQQRCVRARAATVGKLGYWVMIQFDQQQSDTKATARLDLYFILPAPIGATAADSVRTCRNLCFSYCSQRMQRVRVRVVLPSPHASLCCSVYFLQSLFNAVFFFVMLQALSQRRLRAKSELELGLRFVSL